MSNTQHSLDTYTTPLVTIAIGVTHSIPTQQIATQHFQLKLSFTLPTKTLFLTTN